MPSQLSLFIDPAPARRDDTSRAAAERLEGKLGRLRLAVLNAIRSAGVVGSADAIDGAPLGATGMTADEVAALLNKDVLTIRPRVAELRKLHYIADSGRRRPSSRGRPSIVWIAQPEE